MDGGFFNLHEYEPTTPEQWQRAARSSATPPRLSPPPLLAVNHDVQSLILERAGAHGIASFAAASKEARAATQHDPDLWRRAVALRDGPQEHEFGADVLPPGLWKACLLREPKVERGVRREEHALHDSATHYR